MISSTTCCQPSGQDLFPVLLHICPEHLPHPVVFSVQCGLHNTSTKKGYFLWFLPVLLALDTRYLVFGRPIIDYGRHGYLRKNTFVIITIGHHFTCTCTCLLWSLIPIVGPCHHYPLSLPPTYFPPQPTPTQPTSFMSPTPRAIPPILHL